MKRSNIYLAGLALVFDLAAVMAGMLIAYNLRADGTQLYYWPFSLYLRFVLLTLPVWLVGFSAVGLYNARALPKGWNAMGRLVMGLILCWGGILIFLYLWRSPQAQSLPRLIIAYGVILTAIFSIFERVILTAVINSLYRSGVGSVKTIIVGSGNDKDHFIRELYEKPHHGHEVLAIFDGSESIKNLDEYADKYRVDELIIDCPKLPEIKLLSLLNWAESRGINFVLVPSVLSVRATNVEMGTLAGTPVMYFLRTPLEGWQRVYKRIFDIFFSLLALIILSPVFLILIIIQLLTTGTPIFYREPRIGQDGTTFYVHKIRSMYSDWRKKFPNAKDWSADEKTDPRITPFGRIIRKTNLDELPQLWEIFVGKMSIVGPRPEQPKYVAKFSEEVPDYLKRHHVKTGLTGWAQVNGLRGNTSISERVKYDLYYIQNWSILFDIRIILATFIMIFRQLFRPEK